jgi:hypothetical protein
MSDERVWREPMWHKVLHVLVLAICLQTGEMIGVFILGPCLEATMPWWIDLFHSIQMGG